MLSSGTKPRMLCSNHTAFSLWKITNCNVVPLLIQIVQFYSVWLVCFCAECEMTYRRCSMPLWFQHWKGTRLALHWDRKSSDLLQLWFHETSFQFIINSWNDLKMGCVASGLISIAHLWLLPCMTQGACDLATSVHGYKLGFPMQKYFLANEKNTNTDQIIK